MPARGLGSAHAQSIVVGDGAGEGARGTLEITVKHEDAATPRAGADGWGQLLRDFLRDAFKVGKKTAGYGAAGLVTVEGTLVIAAPEYSVIDALRQETGRISTFEAPAAPAAAKPLVHTEIKVTDLGCMETRKIDREPFLDIDQLCPLRTASYAEIERITRLTGVLNSLADGRTSWSLDQVDILVLDPREDAFPPACGEGAEQDACAAPRGESFAAGFDAYPEPYVEEAAGSEGVERPGPAAQKVRHRSGPPESCRDMVRAHLSERFACQLEGGLAFTRIKSRAAADAERSAL